MKFIISYFTIWLAFSIAAAAQTKLLQQADSLYKHYEAKAALAAYNQVLKDESDNFTALWCTSLLYARIGTRTENEDQKENYFKHAIKRAKHAFKIKPKNTHSNYAMAVAMGCMALIADPRERIAASKAIRKYAKHAIRFDSTNAAAWHLLGRWNYGMNNLNFFERLAANVLFGGLPEGASMQKAAKYIKKAIELNPNHITYYYDLAKVYNELDKEEKAIAVCHKALKLPSIAPSDESTKEDCRELINDIL